MSNTYRVLGQDDLPATTLTPVYTVPSSTEAVISTIIIANRANTAKSFRIAIQPNGASIANKHYIAYDVPIGANA